jgi:hypothetical protein
MSAMQVWQVVLPEFTSTRPSGSVVAVGYQRPYDMDRAGVHVCVDGLKMLVSGMPTYVSRCPPTASTRPSGSEVCPVQNRLSTVGISATKLSVAGSHTKTLLLMVVSTS